MGIDNVEELKNIEDHLYICDLKQKPHRLHSHSNIKGREGVPHCVNPRREWRICDIAQAGEIVQ